MCPCRTVRSLPRTVGVSPAQDASLRAEPNRLMSPISASRTSAVNGPTPGSWVSTLTRGSRPGPLVHLPVEPVDRLLQGVDQRQGVLDDLAGDRGQLQRGQPGPARAAPAAARPAVTVVGQDRVDPVAQQRPQPHQLRPVPQQRPQLAHRRRGDPRLRQQVGAQQLRQDRRVDLVVLQPRRGDRLALQRVHQVRVEPVVLQQLHQPPPAERGLERRRACRRAGRRSRDRIGSTPLGTLRLASTSPS